MEKRVQDYSKEILKIIRSNTSPAVMGERLQDYHENAFNNKVYLKMPTQVTSGFPRK